MNEKSQGTQSGPKIDWKSKKKNFQNHIVIEKLSGCVQNLHEKRILR